ncbi:hypothetical protein HBI70_051590 [Parastagonospora nodorum]|nr:hypothetical protein HBI75_028870 [Parastagonospora nodorum]KAH5142610.1 hypothetical protein HBH69_196890 [Parastagonospora nodorum]KAH5285255.1 hypothetical protein HBI70_051590 [Parastagonospora nodorum]KAH5438237.1 hypothetical protein HBI47_061010 [Parastagonospora nodorum]KAH6378814.1 hypothetical protein HBI34_020960 [Parastagonospora nodorum]
MSSSARMHIHGCNGQAHVSRVSFPQLTPDENHANGLFYRRLCAQLAFVLSSPLLHKARAVFRIAHLENLVGIPSSRGYTSPSEQVDESGSRAPSASTWQPRSVWLLVQPCQPLATPTG